MAFALDKYLGYNSADGGAAQTTLTLTSSQATAAGVDVFVQVSWWDTSPSPVPSVSDNGPGLIYSPVVSFVQGDERCRIFRAWSPSAIPSGTVWTATWSPASLYRRIAVATFAGGDGAALAAVLGPTATGGGTTAAVDTADVSMGSDGMVLMFCGSDAFATMAWSAGTEVYDEATSALGSVHCAFANVAAGLSEDANGTLSTANPWCAAAIAFYLAAATPPQTIRPDADVITTGWTTTPLWSKVDEAVADDADFITSTAV